MVVATFMGVTTLLGPLLHDTLVGWTTIEFVSESGAIAGQAIYWSFLLLAWQLVYLGHRLAQRFRDAELDTVRNYLALEAVRFEGRLACDFDLPSLWGALAA
ncbi:MAG: hypothetical protein VYE73_07140 [Acidobacteriota bacterium]|nr:hypothetical protein [Acidobacteriota bacterium]